MSRYIGYICIHFGLFLKEGWGLVCIVIIIVAMYTSIIMCCCGKYCTNQQQPYAPMGPFEANPLFEQEEMHFVQPTSFSPIPIHYA